MLLEIVYSWSQLQSVNQAVHESGASESSVIAAYAFLRECSSDWVLRRSEHVKIGGRGLMGVQRNSPPLAVVSGPELSSPKLSSATISAHGMALEQERCSCCQAALKMRAGTRLSSP